MRKKTEPRDISHISQNSPESLASPSESNSLISADEDDRLLRIDEAARFLGLSTGGLYRLVCQQRIPGVRISSRCIRFSRRALSKWVESLTQEAKQS
jgi:excisionase family DNA binding protein